MTDRPGPFVPFWKELLAEQDQAAEDEAEGLRCRLSRQAALDIAHKLIETGGWEHAVSILKNEYPNIEIEFDFRHSVPHVTSLAEALQMYWRFKQEDRR